MGQDALCEKWEAAVLDEKETRMSEVKKEFLYTPTHEWCSMEEKSVCTIGITDHAQALLGDIVFIELPEVGQVLEQGQESGVIESVKAASDIYSPVTGKVLEVNEALVENPQWVNQAPFDKGWLFKVLVSESMTVDHLLSSEAYFAQVTETS